MNAAAKRSCSKLEHLLSKSPAYKRVGDDFFVVRQGSAYVYVVVIPWGEDRALVRFVAQLVSGVDMNPDLAMKLLRLNSRMRFGAFGYVHKGQCVTFSHTLLGGKTLDDDEVLATLRDVALVADEYDDDIIAEAGGRTMQQLVEDSALGVTKDELEHKGWADA